MEGLTKNDRSGLVLLALILILVGMLYIPALVSGDAVSSAQLRALPPYLFAFFSVLMAGAFAPRTTERLLIVGIFILCIYESVVGLSQVFSLASSNHPLFSMTGTLANPGPYGGLVAVAMAVAVPWSLRIVRMKGRPDLKSVGFWLSALAAAATALGFLVLPASMSRAAWIALVVSVMVFGFLELEWGRKIAGLNRWWLVAGAVLAVAAVAGLFVLKPDSALGRLHIWRIDLLAMLDSPLTGSGVGYRTFAFGQAQASFYASAARSPLTVSLSSCTEESFNEFLSLGVVGGIPALALSLLISLSAVRILVRRRSPLAYGLICWLVFSCFSYPLSVPHLAVLLSVFLSSACAPADAGRPFVSRLPLASAALLLSALSLILWVRSIPEVSGRKEAEKEYEYSRMFMQDGSYDVAVRSFKPLKEALSDNFRYLYDYGYSLHQEGRYDESSAILARGAAISCDPVFHTIMGKNAEALGDFSLAEEEYSLAMNMVPCRLYPRCLLMELKVKQGDYRTASEYAAEALSLPVNPRHLSMQDIHARIQACADTLKMKTLPIENATEH